MSIAERLTEQLRQSLLWGLHTGRLKPGDRLPSIRAKAAEVGHDHRAVAGAYRRLELEGLVEVRPRSGVFVARQERWGREEGLWSETARWVAGVTREAWLRRIPLPDLPGVIERCTATARLRCVCVESIEDAMTGMMGELRDDFGFDPRPVYLDGEESEGLERKLDLQGADLVITTNFHAAAMAPIAEREGVPMVIFTVNPELREHLLRTLADGLDVVLVDPAHADRLRTFLGNPERERLQVHLADDVEVDELEASRALFLSIAARERLGVVDHPRLVEHPPIMSPETARDLTEQIVRLSLNAERD